MRIVLTKLCIVLFLVSAGIIACSREEPEATPGDDAKLGSQARERLREPLAAGKDLLKKGCFIEAEALAFSLLSDVERAAGPPSIATADVLDLLVEAERRSGKGHQVRSLVHAEWAADLRETLQGPDSPDLAGSLTGLGLVLDEVGDYESALAVLERALSIRESTLGEDDLVVARSLNNVALVLTDMGDYARARLLHEKSLAIREKIHAPPEDIANALNNFAGLLMDLGEYEAARPFCERALAIREAALGLDHPDTASSLELLGNLLRDTGSYREARRPLERCLDIREATLGPEHLDVAKASRNLGNVLSDLGYCEEARGYFERSMAIRDRILPPDHPDLVSGLNGLATALALCGDYAAAKSCTEKALAVCDRTLAPGHPQRVVNLLTLCLVLAEMGDFKGARSAAESARSEQEKSHAYPVLRAFVLENLAVVESYEENYEKAVALCRQAVETRESMGDRGIDAAGNLSNLATALYKTGNPIEAKAIYEKAIAMATAATGAEHPIVGLMLSGMGDAVAAAGDARKAIELYARSDTILKQSLGAEHPFRGVVLASLARAQLRSHRDSHAFETALRAEEISREHLRLTARALPERQGLRYAATRSSALDVVLSMAGRRGDGIPEAVRLGWDCEIRSRAIVLDEMASRHRVPAEAGDPKIKKLQQDLNKARQRLANLWVRGT